MLIEELERSYTITYLVFNCAQYCLFFNGESNIYETNLLKFKGNQKKPHLNSKSPSEFQ